MGFGDFAMGYLVGQSFSGPNHIPDGNAPYSEWSAQAKKDWDKKCDEAYWRAWDRAYLEGILERMENTPEACVQTAKKLGIDKPTLIREIKNGNIKIVTTTTNPNIPDHYVWADDSREEAQTEAYKEYLAEAQKIMAAYEYRIL